MKKGFTFIELLLVIIILGVLTLVSAPSLKNSFNDFKLNNSTKEIALLIRQLQAKAVNQSEVYRLQIDKGRGVLLPLEKKNNQWQPLIQGKIKQVFLPQAMNLSTLPENKENIFFYPDGSIDKVDIVLENEAGKKTILTFEDITGNVKIKEGQQ